MREYKDYIRVMLKDGERELIKKRMKEVGIVNMSGYIRKMAIDGMVVIMDLSAFNEVARLLHINANNLNQYTKRANETGSIYLEDIREIQRQQEEILNALKEISRRLSTIK